MRAVLLRATPVAIIASLCAISASPIDASHPALTVATYRTQAGAICAKEQRQTMASLMQSKNLAPYLTAELPVLRTALAAFRRLVPPAKLASLHGDVVATVQRELQLFTTFALQAQAGDLTVAQFEGNRQRLALTKHELGLWKRIGASACTGP